MPDARSYLRVLDRIEPPDVWEHAVSREPIHEQDQDETGSASPRKRATAAVVAFAVFGVAALFAIRAFDSASTDRDSGLKESPPGDARGLWQALPESPLSPRYGALAFWVDGRVVIMGGSESEPCALTANCGVGGHALRDGAAFVPSAGTWTSIAPSPLPVLDATGAVLGDTIYLWADRYPGTSAFLSYDANEDLWTELPTPREEAIGCCLLVATDDAVVAYLDSQERGVFPDLLYDPTTSQWRELLPDPLISSFDRSMVWTGEELLLLAVEIEDVSQTDESSYRYRAAALDIASGKWRRLPDSDIAGFAPTWFWSAGRAVNPTIGRVGDNGDVIGSGPPNGGRLDPTTGAWSNLPPRPKNPREYGGPSVGGNDHVVTWQGAILDVAAGSWTSLPAPPVAADEGAAAAWAGDRLIVWGGYAWEGDPYQDPLSAEATLLNTGWWWKP
jgi:hypothetical protein